VCASVRYLFPNLKSLVLAECPIRSLALEENRNTSNVDDHWSKEEGHGRQDSANMNHLDADERTSSTDEKGNRIFESKVNYDRSESESESNGTTIKSPHDPFRMLRFLNLNGTLLSTWDEVERLARFPALKSLRIQGCPLFEVSGLPSRRLENSKVPDYVRHYERFGSMCLNSTFRSSVVIKKRYQIGRFHL